MKRTASARFRFVLLLILGIEPALAIPVYQAPLLGNVPELNALAPQLSAAAAGRIRDGYQALLRKDLKAAEAAFQEAAKLSPKAAAPLVALADIRLRVTGAAEATQLLDQAQALAPADAEVVVARARLSLIQDNPKEAEFFLRKALQVNPASAIANLELGELFMRSGKFGEAEQSFRKASSLQSNSSLPWFGIARAAAAQKDYPDAEAAFIAAARFAPQDPLPRHALGRLYAEQKKFPQAIGAMTDALAAEARYLPALSDRGDLNAEVGNDAAAASDYKDALALSPDNAGLRTKRGVVLMRSGHRPEALAEFRKAVAIEPRMALAQNNIAWLLLITDGDLAEARRAAQASVNSAPQVPTFLDTLGWVARKQGLLPESVSYLEQAANLAPNDAAIHYHLGVVYAESDRKTAAIAALRHAIGTKKAFTELADAQRLLAQLEK